MSDAPDRTIGGPPPRSRAGEQDLSRLIAGRREAAPVAPAPVPAEVVQLEQPSGDQVAAAAATAPRARKAPARKAKAPAPGPAVPEAPVESVVRPTVKQTTYIDRATQQRARAAFRATSVREGDASWSDFVERAIVAETERREEVYNKGRAYTPDNGRFPAGRPLG